jgi:hypothetical protein
MAVNYVFIGTENNTATILTDASDLNFAEFTVTEIRNVGSQDVIDGLNYNEGQEFLTELELIALATDNTWQLDRYLDSELESILVP